MLHLREGMSEVMRGGADGSGDEVATSWVDGDVSLAPLGTASRESRFFLKLSLAMVLSKWCRDGNRTRSLKLL